MTLPASIKRFIVLIVTSIKVFKCNTKTIVVLSVVSLNTLNANAVQPEELFIAGTEVNIVKASNTDSESLTPTGSAQNNPSFSKVVFSSRAQMRKFAISFHHTLLEIDYDKLFAIAELSQKDKQALKDLNIVFIPATKWSKRFDEFNQKRLTTPKTNGIASTQKAAGIPGFACYATVEETLQQGLDLSMNYPNLAEWIDIGDSWSKANGDNGYDLMVLKISNKDIIEEKPKLFIHSSMHAREYAPAALTLEFAYRLLEDYETDADIRWIVDYHEVHILFQMNPDGRKIAETSISQRKNTNGNHCPNTPNGWVGVDLNRNFAHFWNVVGDELASSSDECEQTYRGVSAESEPETQAVSEYIRSIFVDARGDLETDAAPSTTTGIHLDIHSYSELVLWPYGHTESVSPNDSGFVALGNKLAWFNDYTPQQSIGLYATDGTSDDVSYGELGVAALTFELGTSFFEDCTTYESKIKPDNLKALFYAAKSSAMPYLLPKGPEVSKISLNDSENGITVSRGTEIELIATLNTNRTKLSGSGRTISKAEYSIDEPIWLETTETIELTGTDGNLSSEEELFNITLDTTNLSDGEHILYVRGFNESNQPGVAKAIFVNIGENSSPTPSFTVSCTDLNCNFDASQSSDTDGTIISFNWNFGDGSTATDITSQHTFSSAGIKTISLTITDNSENTSETSESVTVNEPSPPPTNNGENSISGSGSTNLLFLVFVCLTASLRRYFLESDAD